MPRHLDEATVDQRGLVERAREGDHDAFAVLARTALPRLDAAARLILRDRELARDAVQDACIRAWRDLPGLRDPERFEAWLHRLTVHACLDIARKRRHRVIEVELTPISTPFVGDTSSAFADRELLDEAMRRLEPSSSTTSWVCRSRMSLPSSASHSGPRSPVCTDRSASCE